MNTKVTVTVDGTTVFECVKPNQIEAAMCADRWIEENDAYEDNPAFTGLDIRYTKTYERVDGEESEEDYGMSDSEYSFGITEGMWLSPERSRIGAKRYNGYWNC